MAQNLLSPQFQINIIPNTIGIDSVNEQLQSSETDPEGTLYPVMFQTADGGFVPQPQDVYHQYANPYLANYGQYYTQQPGEYSFELPPPNQFGAQPPNISGQYNEIDRGNQQQFSELSPGTTHESSNDGYMKAEPQESEILDMDEQNVKEEPLPSPPQKPMSYAPQMQYMQHQMPNADEGNAKFLPYPMKEEVRNDILDLDSQKMVAPLGLHPDRNQGSPGMMMQASPGHSMQHSIPDHNQPSPGQPIQHPGLQELNHTSPGMMMHNSPGHQPHSHSMQELLQQNSQQHNMQELGQASSPSMPQHEQAFQPSAGFMMPSLQMQQQPSPLAQDVKSPYSGYGSPSPQQPTTAPTPPVQLSEPPQAKGGKVDPGPKKKSYNCTTCNKWFTSSGHLKRHYNTTLHKNAVKSSGQEDPALMPIKQIKREAIKDPDPPQHEDMQMIQHMQMPGQIESYQQPNLFMTGHPNGLAGLSASSRGLQSSSINMEECNSSIINNNNHAQPVLMDQMLKEEKCSPTNLQHQGNNYQHIYITPPKDENYTTLETFHTMQAHQPQLIYQQAQQHQGQPLHLLSAPQLDTIFPRTMQTLVDQSGQFFITPLGSRPTQDSTSNLTPFHSHMQLLPGQQAGFPTIIGNMGETTSGPAYPSPPSHSPSGSSYPSPLSHAPSGSGYPSPSTHAQDGSSYPSPPSQSPSYSSPPTLTPSCSSEVRPKPAPTSSRKAVKRKRVTPSQDKIVCVECDKEFTKICYLSQHNKAFHMGSMPFRCQKCGKRFANETAYETHLDKHTAQDKPFKCDACPKQFHHKTDLRRHSESIHDGFKAHVCVICSKSFSRKDHLRKHIDTHDRNKQKTRKDAEEHVLIHEMTVRPQEEDYVMDDEEIFD